MASAAITQAAKRPTPTFRPPGGGGVSDAGVEPASSADTSAVPGHRRYEDEQQRHEYSPKGDLIWAIGHRGGDANHAARRHSNLRGCYVERPSQNACHSYHAVGRVAPPFGSAPALVAGLLLDRALGPRDDFEPGVGDRFPALDRAPVGALRQPALGALHRFELLLEAD